MVGAASALLKQASELAVIIEFAAKKAAGMVSFVEDETKQKLKKLQETIDNPEEADLRASRMLGRINEFEALFSSLQSCFNQVTGLKDPATTRPKNHNSTKGKNKPPRG